MVHNVVKEKSSGNLTIKNKGFNGRPEDSMLLDVPNTKYGRKMFSYKGLRLWNALPTYIREEQGTGIEKKVFEYMR